MLNEEIRDGSAVLLHQTTSYRRAGAWQTTSGSFYLSLEDCRPGKHHLIDLQAAEPWATALVDPPTGNPKRLYWNKSSNPTRASSVPIGTKTEKKSVRSMDVL